YKNYKSKKADVVITDKLDENVEFVVASDDGACEDGTVTWTLKDVEAGKNGTVTLTVKVKDSAKTVGRVQNKATVKVGNDTDFDTNIEENPVPEDPEKKETSPFEGTGLLGSVSAGDEITYKISYKNYKSKTADVKITDPLDENVDFVSASDGGREKGGTVTWTIKDVAAGKEGNVTLKVRVKDGVKGELINNQAHVQVGNDAVFDTEVVTNPTTDDPVKTETKPGEGAKVKPGDKVYYEISYHNYRPETADVTVTDRLDKNVKFISANKGGKYDAGTHTITWTIKDVPGDDRGKVKFTVKVLKGAYKAGKIKNQASVKVGNDKEVKTNIVKNPVEPKPGPEPPVTDDRQPKTGDDSSIVLWIAIAVTSLAALLVMVFRRRMYE
ncbi:MAG: DUF11 domain-containing protein, partial [Firmicutes bacterium]|nr:DUF11 domain-containing protein [Bacillota bacterium]